MFGSKTKALLPAVLIALLLLGLNVALLAIQDPSYGDEEDTMGPPPPDANAKVEWIFARLDYGSGTSDYNGYGFHRWAADYPKADRQLLQGVRRLTRINTRSTGVVLNLDNDELYNYPWLYVEDPGQWRITEPQAKRLREYLLRGGFLMAEDMHGDFEWANFMTGMRMAFPDRVVEDLKDQDELFRVVYDISGDRFQIPGTRYIWGGRRYTPDSAVPKWRAIRDDKGRIMVAICFNSDVGDAWEWADSPEYPERDASLAFRIAVNYIIYGMTH